MSTLTPCNFCNLRWIKKRARITGDQVTLVMIEPSEAHPLGGVDVLVHPADEQPDREKHFHAWFMALSDHCCC